MTDPLKPSPLVSVILPVYNGEDHLRSAIESVLTQDYGPLEIIIVDDGSTDRSAEIAKQYVDMGIARYLRQENAGPAAARSFGIAQAKGEFIAFIDADDLWPDHKLTRQVQCLEDHPEAAIVQGPIERITLQEKDSRQQEIRDPDFPFIYTNLGAMLVRKNVFDRLGAFASDLRYHEDTDFWLRTREANLPVLVMPQTALIYRIHGSNLTTGQTLKSTGFIRILKRSLDRRKATQTGPQRAAVPPLTLVGQSATRASHVDYANFSVNGKPRVSIILHQSAREDDCDQALQSILNQGVQPLELVLTGQHIPEETITKAQDAFGQIHIVNAISDDLADQLNEAVSLAQGEWLTFLSTNAVWTEGKLKAQLDVLRTDPKIKIVSGHTSPIIDPRKPYPAKTLDSLQLQKRIGDFLDTLMVERSILDEIGPFKNKASGMMETDWLLRAKDLGFTPLVLPKVLLYRTIKPETNAPSPEELRSALFNSLHSSIQRKRKPKTD